jgi:cell division protein FtsI/penicillin-binding protein 2
MLNIINAVASGGVIYRPYVVNRILNSFNNQPVRIFKPQILKNISLSQKNLSLIRRGLEGVMTYGTGAVIGRASRIKIIGKTGTTQLYKGTPHAWFVGYTPADRYKDQYSIVTFIEHGGGGGEKAVPLAVAALQSILLDQDPYDLKQFFLDRLEAVQYERFLRKKQLEDQQNEDKHLQDIQF